MCREVVPFTGKFCSHFAVTARDPSGGTEVLSPTPFSPRLNFELDLSVESPSCSPAICQLHIISGLTNALRFERKKERKLNLLGTNDNGRQFWSHDTVRYG
jgi:hypothetical protein